MRHTSVLTFLLFFFAILYGQSQHTITVEEAFYRVDPLKRIILVNMAPADVNNQWPALKTHIYLDDDYRFSDPIVSVEKGKGYELKFYGVPHTVFFTELPVVSISTPNTIDPDLKVAADFLLTEKNGTSIRSYIGIEYRGASTSYYPKKSYLMELWENPEGTEKGELSLLHMRTDGDWVLTSMYNETNRIRSKTAHALWLQMNSLAYQADEPEAVCGARNEYVELFLNDDYKGVYLLGERIDRKQLKLKKYDGAIRGELYKGVGWDYTLFGNVGPYSNSNRTWGGFEYEYPDEVTHWQNLHNFVDFVVNSTDANFYANYPSKFDRNNAVDYFIFLNLVRAIDNTGKNIYLAKYQQGSPYFYVPWDLDGVLGASWDGSRSSVTNDLLSNGFYDRLLLECSFNGFAQKVQERWTFLRSSLLTKDNLLAQLSINQNYLLENGVYARESLAWPDFNYDESELDYTSEWISNRLSYLDDRFSSPCTIASALSKQEFAFFKLYPNPTENTVVITLSPTQTSAELSLYTSGQQAILKTMLSSGENTLDISSLPAGIYFLQIRNEKWMSTEKLVKY